MNALTAGALADALRSIRDGIAGVDVSEAKRVLVNATSAGRALVARGVDPDCGDDVDDEVAFAAQTAADALTSMETAEAEMRSAVRLLDELVAHLMPLAIARGEVAHVMLLEQLEMFHEEEAS